MNAIVNLNKTGGLTARGGRTAKTDVFFEITEDLPQNWYFGNRGNIPNKQGKYKLINYCVTNNPKPVPQSGTPQVYKRIKDNLLKFDSVKGLSYIYDQIRMVDNDLYPNSYLDVNGFRLEFSRAKLKNSEVIADVKIKLKP